VLDLIPHRPVASLALLEHSSQHRHFPVNIGEDANIELSPVLAMKATGVLDQGTLPCDGQSQQQGVKAGIVESLADEASRRQQDPLLRVGDPREFLGGLPPGLRAGAPFEDHDVPGNSSEALGKEVKVVPPLCEEDG
jgi:hypothetical protein